MTTQVQCNEAGCDCQFLVQSENEDELATFVQTHSRGARKTDVSREQVEQLTADV